MLKPTLKLLAVCVLLAIPALVQAEFTYTTNSGTVIITGYTGSNGVVTIPVTNFAPLNCFPSGRYAEAALACYRQ